jgi:hypothetical protein
MKTEIMNRKLKMERLLELVASLSRPGTDKVVKFIKESDFSSKHGGDTHHKYPGGLVDHSLEVYENMKVKAEGLGISEETIIICSIFHDLGKVVVHKGHAGQSLAILDNFGFELTEEERMAIGSHHHPDVTVLELNTLSSILMRSDGLSTGLWKKAHPKPGMSAFDKLKNDALLKFCKR